MEFLPTDFPSEKTVKTFDRGLYLVCKATGHPQPKLTWFKDNIAISESDEFYEIAVNEIPIDFKGYNVTSILYWKGKFLFL